MHRNQHLLRQDRDLHPEAGGDRNGEGGGGSSSMLKDSGFSDVVTNSPEDEDETSISEREGRDSYNSFFFS